MQSMNALLVNTREAAKLVGICRSSWLYLHAQGRVPKAIQGVTSRPLWRVAELTAWVEAGCPDARDWTWQPA